MNRRNWFKSAVATVGSLLGISVLPKRANCVEIDGKEYPVIQFNTVNNIKNVEELFGDKFIITAYLPKYRAAYVENGNSPDGNRTFIYGVVDLLYDTTFGTKFGVVHIYPNVKSTYFQLITKPATCHMYTRKAGFHYGLVTEKI